MTTEQKELQQLKREVMRLREVIQDAYEMLSEPTPCPEAALYILESVQNEHRTN